MVHLQDLILFQVIFFHHLHQLLHLLHVLDRRHRHRTSHPTAMSLTRQNQTEIIQVVFTGVVDLTPVPIYPSLRQIMNATEMVRYGDIVEPLNTTCPITQETFSENDSVCQIKHCKHIFKNMCLYNWFLEHVDCPSV